METRARGRDRPSLLNLRARRPAPMSPAVLQYFSVGSMPGAQTSLAMREYEAGNLISQRRSGSTYYHLYDQLGSTRKLLDSSQATTDSYSYYAFGEVRSSSGSTTNPFKFVGRLGYYDDPTTPFQYLRARYYGSTYGRFLTQDSAARGPREYTYVEGNPIVSRDASGLQEYCEWCAWKWKETVVDWTGEWVGWRLHDAYCRPCFPYGFQLVCLWQNKREYEGRRRYCRWCLCRDVQECNYHWHKRCGRWIPIEGTETLTYPLGFPGECGEGSTHEEMMGTCDAHGPPGGWPRLRG